MNKKKVFNKETPYTLSWDEADGVEHYYVSFKDGQGVPQESEVPYSVFAELIRLSMDERNLHRWNQRHVEQLDLTEKQIANRAKDVMIGVEETIIMNELNARLRQAIAELSEVQRRRFTYYHLLDYTYEQIAKQEDCSTQAVAKSVKAAESILKDNLINMS